MSWYFAQVNGLGTRVSRLRLAALGSICLLLAGCGQSTTEPSQTGDPVVQMAASAAVAMPDPFAADIAAAVLESGGNAVDAAVAVGFSLAVTLPDAGNIGGGGFMTLYVDGKPYFLDYRETAPAAASRDMYLESADESVTSKESGGSPRVTDESQIGHRASGVPGTVAGLWAVHERFGRRPWAELLQPAIRLAREGFEVPEPLRLAMSLSGKEFAGRTNFDAYFTLEPGSRVLHQPELARTLERIASRGRDDFYLGETAGLIVAEMQRGGGLISAADLAGYQAIWRAPIDASWRDYRILTAPLPSSGGFAVVQFLKIKDLLADAFAGQKHNSPQYLHLKAEIEKRIFADRAEYLGDPDFVDVPIDALLSDDYLRRRAAEVDPLRISSLATVQPGLEPIHTTHFSILDREGNAVANTYTLNTDFGSGVVVEGGGFLLNNEMDDFAVAPGVPNFYGVVGNEANAIAPGKRMLSSMTPTILLRDGNIAMVLGAMGGSTIFTSVYQVMVNSLDFGMSAEQAVSVSRVHHQLLPYDLITYSPTVPLSETTIRGLEDRGYRVEPHFFEFGNLQLITRAVDGETDAASDPRFHGRSRVLH